MKKKYTIPELKQICKEKKIKNYSKLKRAELLAKCLQGEAAESKDYKVHELKAMCKEKKIKGYSNLTKKELLQKCLEEGHQKVLTRKELISLCKEKKLKGYSKMGIEELRKFCSDKKPKAYSEYKVEELKAMCKEKKIKGYYKMKREELLANCFEHCFAKKYDDAVWDRIKMPPDHHCGYHSLLYALDNVFPSDPKVPSKDLPYEERILELKKILVHEMKKEQNPDFKNVITEPIRWMEDHDLNLFANYFNICICVYESEWNGVLPSPFNHILPVAFDKKTIADCDRKIYLYHTGNHFDVLFPKSSHIKPLPEPSQIVMSSKDIFHHSLPILSQQDIDMLKPVVQSEDASVISDKDLMIAQEEDTPSPYSVMSPPKQGQIISPEEIVQEEGQIISPEKVVEEEGQIISPEEGVQEEGQIISPEEGQIVQEEDSSPEQGQIVQEEDSSLEQQIISVKPKKQKKQQKKKSPKIPDVPVFTEKSKEVKVREVIEKCFSKYRVPDYLLFK